MAKLQLGYRRRLPNNEFAIEESVYLGWIEAESVDAAEGLLHNFMWARALETRGYEVVWSASEPDLVFGHQGFKPECRLTAAMPPGVAQLLVPSR